MTFKAGMISKAFSIYLDLIRFLAAMGVFTSHLSYQLIDGGIGWQPLCREKFTEPGFCGAFRPIGGHDPDAGL
jgi:peptidoglycan/LPS O-acetylase OafA/YrhL